VAHALPAELEVPLLAALLSSSKDTLLACGPCCSAPGASLFLHDELRIMRAQSCSATFSDSCVAAARPALLKRSSRSDLGKSAALELDQVDPAGRVRVDRLPKLVELALTERQAEHVLEHVRKLVGVYQTGAVLVELLEGCHAIVAADTIKERKRARSRPQRLWTGAAQPRQQALASKAAASKGAAMVRAEHGGSRRFVVLCE
jgi:hypothetical protein